MGRYLVRETVAGAAAMDLRIWPEPIVLSVVARHLDVVPRVHAISRRPAYQIREWIDGSALNDIAPEVFRCRTDL